VEPMSAGRRCSTRKAVAVALVAVVTAGYLHGCAGAKSNAIFSGPPTSPFGPTPVAGNVDDTTCDVEQVERANEVQLNALLNEVMNTTFFSLFRVSLKEQCRFWQPAAGAAGKAGKDAGPPEKCTHDLPQVSSLFGSGSGSTSPLKPRKKACDLDSDGPASNPFKAAKASDPVDVTMSPVAPSFSASDDCDLPEFWLDMCREIESNSKSENDGDSTTAQYVDLRRNPERWTGYNGSKVWAAIYDENCFTHASSVGDMCYEERVLYRLLSGMHSSINIHIALSYFPPSTAAKRSNWAPNPGRFSDLFTDSPERLKNLHFAFVVSLRALRKASTLLYDYNYTAEDDLEGEHTSKLVRRLLDTRILNSCSQVFEAFDESLMFGEQESPSAVATLKQNFKGVFQNISKLMDCVSCQKCKLHGKLALLGVGTALKVLLLPDAMVQAALTREEIVALVQTVGKFSQAITGIKELTRLTWEESYFKEEQKTKSLRAQEEKMRKVAENAAAVTLSRANAAAAASAKPLPQLQHDELADAAVGLVLKLSATGHLSDSAETRLIERALMREPNILILAKRFHSDPAKFLKFASIVASSPGASAEPELSKPVLDAVVVGGGLAGLTAALTIADRGGSVMVVDKNRFTGGNSAYASSGINAVSSTSPSSDDSVISYLNDTVKSSGRNYSLNDETLMSVLTGRSFLGLQWFRERVKLPLDQKGQLGGHSAARTYRPSTGMAGSEMIFAITKIMRKLAKESDSVKLGFGMRLDKLETDDQGTVTGVKLVNLTNSDTSTVLARNVILATGGFANDMQGNDSLIKKYRPDLMEFQTTNGPFATGDGHKIAIQAGAATVDMDQVQVHPTAFAGSSGGEGDRLTLCAEILRGVGAILLDQHGHRFANELGKRDYLVAEMKNAGGRDLVFSLILPEAGAKIANKHVPHYMKKGLLQKYDSVEAVAEAIGVPTSELVSTFELYKQHAAAGRDPYGKLNFHTPTFDDAGAPFYVGNVTPALHYSLGGIAIDTKGRVKRSDGNIISGLYAAGEVTGGVHGVNRLGGNALTECVVFGQLVGEQIRIGKEEDVRNSATLESTTTESLISVPDDSSTAEPLRSISAKELEEHSSREDCWIAVYGKVYDFTSFVDEHPGGVDTILDHAGLDGTEVFDAVHTRAMLDDFEPIGILA